MTKPLNLELLNQAHVETAKDSWTSTGWCRGCFQRWPCTVRQLLDLLEKAKTRAETVELRLEEAVLRWPGRINTKGYNEQQGTFLHRMDNEILTWAVGGFRPNVITLDIKDAERLLEIVKECDSIIGWNTTCAQCAHLWDKNYAMYCNIEELRDALGKLVADNDKRGISSSAKTRAKLQLSKEINENKTTD